MSETTERKDLKCCVCDRSGYFVKNCRSKKQDTKSTYPPSGVCKRTNHTEKECYYKQGGRIDGNGKKEKQKVCFFSGKKESDEWVLDSGTNSHIVNDLNYLNWKKIEIEVGSVKRHVSMVARAKGTVDLGKCTLGNVFYVPNFTQNLISLDAITQKGEGYVWKR